MLTQFVYQDENLTPVEMANEVLQSLKCNTELTKTGVSELHKLSGPGILFIDQAGKLKKTNQRFLYLLGLQKSDILDAPFVKFIDEEDYNIFQIEFSNLVIQRSESLSLEIRLIKNNIEKIWVKINALVIKRQFSDVLIAATIEDITERKLAEVKYQQVSRELEAFLYRASHDLRGPLATLTGICNLAQFEFSDPKVTEYFDMIRSTSERMKDAVQALHKITDVKFSALKIEKVFFDQILDQIFDQLGHTLKESNFKHEIVVDVKDPFFSDKDLIYAILFNIVDNSVKFRRTNRKIAPVIKISITQKVVFEKSIEIILEDNGSGIPVELYEKIFQLFYRGDFRSRGSGLGLYIVDRAVRKLNGEIKVCPSSMNGTCFQITLPY